VRFLLFQVYSPLVSWGEIAVGGERLSARHPSKSAILGLVGAALGIKREEEELHNRLFNSLGIAVKLYSGGSLLADYHTSQVPKKDKKVMHYTRKSELANKSKLGTVLSRREYRSDAFCVIALYCKNELISLVDIEKALQEPVFHLYFGRKSNPPALPLMPVVVEAENLKEVFSQFKVEFALPIGEDSKPWLKDLFEKYPRETLFDKKIYYFWENDLDAGFELLHSVERYDVASSRKRWQFSPREELMSVGHIEEV